MGILNPVLYHIPSLLPDFTRISTVSQTSTVKTITFTIPDTINRGVLGKVRVLWISAAVADSWKIRVKV